MHEALEAASRRWEAWHAAVRRHPVGPRLTNEEVAARLAAHDFGHPRDLRDLTEELADLLEQASLHATHPRYFG
ncbi:MAG TPA: hypothetical protein VFQ51_02160, partial [Vicinamibacteria bacterium]|nr:hypothetical protein [Vicinamibacteria bacterium]